MKIVLIIYALLSVAFAQEPAGLTCNYFLSLETYRCELTINNSNGLDDFTNIGGIHLEGFTNADVTYILRVAGFSPNIPRVICDTFPNLERVTLFDTGLSEISDNSFAGCTQMTLLDLTSNRIRTISSNAFASLTNLEFLYLEQNDIGTLPENVFANQQELILLDLSYNPFDGGIPNGVFQPLSDLRTLFLGFSNLNAINSQWFTSNPNLDYLYLPGNRIELTETSFTGLSRVTYLNLARNNINDIPEGTFAPLESLLYLYLYANNFTELEADFFPNLPNLQYLDISENPTFAIRDGAFRGLSSLTSISISSCRIRLLSSNAFEGLDSLNTLLMNFNEIEELPPGVFAHLSSIIHIGLWNNRVKTLRRSIFDELDTLQIFDLDGNIVNALDRGIIDDAVNLNTLYFSGNLCASNYFGNFLISRNEYLPMLQRCFENMRFIVGK